jgi:two-component system response regulator NreC
VCPQTLIATEPDRPTEPPDHLSVRELEVLRLAALDHTTREIAQKLHLSVRTVESYRSALQHKLGVKSCAELAIDACDRGLIDGP